MDAGRELFSPTPSSPVERIRTAYNRAFVNWQAFWVEAYRDQSFYLNNQWTQEERRYLQQEQRPDYVYNLGRATVNMVQGYQRKHRHSIICQPVENSSNATADIFTKCLYHSLRHGKGHYAISDAFKGALVTGIGYVKISMDYRFDPGGGGDVRYDFYPWNAVIPDPFWTQLDFSDADYLIQRAYMSKEEAISRFPKKRAIIEKMQGNLRDELFTFLPQQRIFQSQNLLCYTEYWEQQYETVKCIVNPFTLQEIEITSENKQLNELAKLPGIKSYTKQKRKMQCYGMLNNEIVYEEENPGNFNEYPYIPIVAVYAPEYDLYQYKLQSLLRCTRDPQIAFNKVISKITDSYDAQINTGWIVKKSRFDNPMDFYKSGQGRVIFAKNEADVNMDAKQIMPTPPAQGLMELQQLFNQLITRICGVNEELLGFADDSDVGILEMLRQGASLVNLQDLFDNLRQSSEIIGNRSMKFMQNNWTPEKVKKVTGKDPTPEFYKKDFGKYDAVCVEAPLTETQQQLFFSQLMQFKQMGMNIPDSVILDAMPMTGKEDLINAIKEQEQQQNQMQQAQMQAQMEDKAIVNELLISESKAKLAMAEERLAKANEDRAGAALDQAKMIKELDGADLDNINKFIETILSVDQAEKALQNQEVGTGV